MFKNTINITVNDIGPYSKNDIPLQTINLIRFNIPCHLNTITISANISQQNEYNIFNNNPYVEPNIQTTISDYIDSFKFKNTLYFLNANCHNLSNLLFLFRSIPLNFVL